MEDNFSKEDFKAFKKYFKLKVNKGDDPLIQAGGMKAMLASYLKHNKAVYKKFKKHHGKSDKEENGDEKVSGKKRKRKSSVVSSEVESVKKSKRPRVSSIVSDVSKKPVTRKMSNDAVMDALDAWNAAAENEAPEKKQPVPYRTGPLKRIDEEAMKALSMKMNNNSFTEKGDDSYGGWSNSKLGHIQGANFIKEKNKMKKRNSHASGTFNAGTVNSIGFD